MNPFRSISRWWFAQTIDRRTALILVPAALAACWYLGLVKPPWT